VCLELTMIIDIVSYVGMGLILIAFIMNQMGKWHHDNRYYDATNAIGSLLLCIYSYLIGAIPFLILNLVWLIVSIKDFVSLEKSNVHLNHKKKVN